MEDVIAGGITSDFPALVCHPVRRSLICPSGKLTISRTPYGKGSEADSIRCELGDFDINQSPAYYAIRAIFGSTIRLRELKGIVNVVRAWWQVRDGTYLAHPSRNAKRSFPLLVKYIDQHYDMIVPRLRHVILRDENGDRIPLLDAEPIAQ